MQFLKLANNRTEHFTSKDFCRQVIKKIEDCILSINNTIEAFDFISGNVKKVDINLYDGYAGYLLFLIYYRKIHQDPPQMAVPFTGCHVRKQYFPNGLDGRTDRR